MLSLTKKLAMNTMVENAMKNGNVYYKQNPEMFIELIEVVETTPVAGISASMKGKYKDVWEWIESVLPEKIMKLGPKVKKATKIQWILHGIEDFPRCKECNVSFADIGCYDVYSITAGYKMFCCSSCATKNKDTIARHEQTNLERHGTRVWTNREQSAKTTFEHFGKTCALAVPEIRTKGAKTMEYEYGEKVFPKTKKYRELSEKKCLEKYGQTCYMKTSEFRERSKKSKLERHGDENWNNHEQAVETCLDKYGVESNFQTEEHKELLRSKREEISNKKRETFRKNYGQDYPPLTKYMYDGLRFDSMPEIAFYIWLTDNRIAFEYQPNISFEYWFVAKDGSFRKMLYHPDFKVGSTFYEIKGSQFFKDDGTMWNPYRRHFKTEESWLESCRRMEAKHQCMLANGVVIMREHDYLKYLKYVWSKYGKVYLQQFRKKDQTRVLLSKQI